MKSITKKYFMILMLALLAFENLECSREDDLGWNPIKDNNRLYAEFLNNMAHGLDEAHQAYEQSSRVDAAQVINQEELFLNISSPAKTFESGVTTQDSRSSSDLSDGDGQYDVLALIFGRDQLTTQKIKKVKIKKKNNPSIDLVACAVAQPVKSADMIKREIEQARRDAQRLQSIAKREAELAAQKAELEAKAKLKEEQRLWQIEQSKSKKTMSAAARVALQPAQDKDHEYLDGLIRAENERKEALAEKIRQDKLAEEVSRIAYQQKKNDVIGMSNCHEVQMLHQSMQDALTFMQTLDLSDSDMEKIELALQAEKNLRYDMLLRGQGASFNDDGVLVTYTCTNFYTDAEFFVEAFKTLDLMVKVDTLLFTKSNKMKKNKKKSVKNFVMNMLGKYVHKELPITPEMYDLFYDIYEKEYDFVKMVEADDISVDEENQGLRKMERFLDAMEIALKKNKQW